MDFRTIKNPEFKDLEIGDVVKWINNGYWLITEIIGERIRGGYVKESIKEAFDSKDNGEYDGSLLYFKKKDYSFLYKKAINLKQLING